MKDKTMQLYGYFLFCFYLLLLAMYLKHSPVVTTKDVYQYIDYDTQVVCYILENGNGISCLPLSEVNLSE